MNNQHSLLEAAYRAFNARDIDCALAMMHADVDWPNGMEGGRVRGRAAVREYWARQWAMIDPHVEPVGFTDENGQVAVEVHQTVRDLDGKLLLDERVQHVYRIVDNLVTSMEIRPARDSTR